MSSTRGITSVDTNSYLVGFLLQGIIVGGLHGDILLVVLPLVVEELLQDLSEGFDLVF